MRVGKLTFLTFTTIGVPQSFNTLQNGYTDHGEMGRSKEKTEFINNFIATVVIPLKFDMQGVRVRMYVSYIVHVFPCPVYCTVWPFRFVSIWKILCLNDIWSPGHWVEYLTIWQLFLRCHCDNCPARCFALHRLRPRGRWDALENGFHRVELLVVNWTYEWVNKMIGMSETS